MAATFIEANASPARPVSDSANNMATEKGGRAAALQHNRQVSNGRQQFMAAAAASSSSASPPGSKAAQNGLQADIRMYKRSQRPTWSCTECARRKIKCDKRIPCQPCIKRGSEKMCSLDHENVYVAAVHGPPAVSSSATLSSAPPVTNGVETTSSPTVSDAHHHSHGLVHRMQTSTGPAASIPEETINIVHQLQDTVSDLNKRLYALESNANRPLAHVTPMRRATISRPTLTSRWSHSFERRGMHHLSTSSLGSPSESLLAAAAARGSPRSEKQEPEGDADTALTFEYLALGKDRTRGLAQPQVQLHQQAESMASPPLPTTKNILAQPSTRVIPEEATKMLLPEKSRDFVLTYAKDAVTWQHACVHSETFARELEAFSSLQPHERWVWTDPLWLALFFVIQSVAVHQMPPSDVDSIFGGASAEAPAMLLDAAQLCLETGRYLSEPNLYTCQALATLCVTGHNVADSNFLSSLLAIGIKTAQMLNLHRLGREDAQVQGYLMSQGGVITDPSPAWRDRIVSLEVGKRVWWSLVQQDYFAMPFCGTSMVNPRQHDTPMPANVHDSELDAGILRSHYDEMDLTLVQKLRLTSKSAQIVYTFFERLPQRQPASLEEHVHPFEAELIALLPPTQPRSSNPRLKFGLALRRYINVGVSHKILVLHRAFCSIPLSADDASHGSTHATPPTQLQISQARGLDAARQILDQVRAINPSGRPEGQVGAMWTISYQAVAAAIVVALTFFRSSVDEASMPGCHVVRKEVLDARAVLASLASRSTIASRGVILLDDLMRSFDESHSQTNQYMGPQTQPQPHISHALEGQLQHSHDQELRQSLDDGPFGGRNALQNTAPQSAKRASISTSRNRTKRLRTKDTNGAETSADTILAQLDADGGSGIPPIQGHRPPLETGPLAAFDLDWDVSSMLQTIPDVSKLFDGSMGNLFG